MENGGTVALLQRAPPQRAPRRSGASRTHAPRTVWLVGPVHRQQMAIRYNGHHPDILVAGADGAVVRRLRLNDSNNNTGMEAVYWHGRAANALLYNGGMLWDLNTGTAIALPDLPHSAPVGRMA